MPAVNGSSNGLFAAYAAGERGARAAARAGAVVVVVDAYRASTTIAVLVEKGARVLPVAGLEEALAAEADYRIGERGSAKVQGFDFGNSPTEVREAEFAPGSAVALSTTNGTRVIEAARGAPAILAGAFVNARAVADHLLSARPGRVVVVGCGWRGRRSSEDEAAAGEILAHLHGRGGAVLDGRARAVVEAQRVRPERLLRTNTAAGRLKRLGYERDLDLCLARDAVPVVPTLVDGVFVGAGGI
jgi:2-phosphosulfolactate phosphatase